MAGSPQNMERGIPGGIVALDVTFRAYNGGPYADDDRFLTTGQLPVVRIKDPSGAVVADSSDAGAQQPTRSAQGRYLYERHVGLDDQISDTWQILWSIRIDGNDLEFQEYFRVIQAGNAEFGNQEWRVGQAFGNPDNTSSHHAPGWGLMLTPDEMRYIVGFGNRLVSPDANQTYDDNMLQLYIDNALAMIERDLNIDIIPRVVRYRDPINTITGVVEPRTDIPASELAMGRYLVREPGYPYRNNNMKHYMYIKLRRRPLISVQSAVMVDPVMNTAINLFSWRKEFPGYDARVQFFPTTTVIGSFPFIPSKLMQANYPYEDFPDAIRIDYRTGFEHANLVDPELALVLRWTAGIMLLEDYGDGKSPGLASASANLNSVSESYSTTQSATNALFGARIGTYKQHLKEWLKNNKEKYTRAVFGVL